MFKFHCDITFYKLRKVNKMKNLNTKQARKEIASLIRDYSFYSEFCTKFCDLCYTEDRELNIIESRYYSSQWHYYSYMEKAAEVKLAEIGIFVNRDLSEERLQEWNWDEYSETFNALLTKANKYEREYEDMKKAVA